MSYLVTFLAYEICEMPLRGAFYRVFLTADRENDVILRAGII